MEEVSAKTSTLAADEQTESAVECVHAEDDGGDTELDHGDDDEFEDERLSDENDSAYDDEKYVLAYRFDGVHKPQVVRVKKSDVERDSTYALFSSQTLPLNFNAGQTVAEFEEKEFRPADAYVLEKLEHRLMVQNVRSRIKDENLSIESIAGLAADVNSLDDPAAHVILALVTNELKSKKLWRDEDQDITMSQAFPLSQAKADPRYQGLTLEEIEYGTYVEDGDIVLDEEAVADEKVELRDTISNPFLYPELSTQMLHNIMRVAPDDLYHVSARRLVESRSFEQNKELTKLFRAAYLCSKNVESPEHFQNIMEDCGLGTTFGHYSFDEYRKDRVIVRRYLRDMIEHYFIGNDPVKRALLANPESEKRDPKNVWPRYFSVWEKLTIKQKNALIKVHMKKRPLTYKEAAAKFKISVNSLASRLRTGFLRFRHEFTEFIGITPKSLPRQALVSNCSNDYLWRADSARFIHQLYKIDVKTGLKIKISHNKLPKSKNLDWKTIAEIKAKIINACPFPHIHETEYFDGLLPTIESYDRKPGNLSDDPSDQANREIGWRHFE